MRRLLAACILTATLFGQGGTDRDRKWREDLDYLVAELTRTHPSLFSRIRQADFDQAVAGLRQSIHSKSDTEVVAGLSRILALARDGHTDLKLLQANTGFRMYPIRVRWFSDGLFVTEAALPYTRAIGKRIVAIAGTPIEHAYLAIREFISYENDPFARLRSQNLLVSPEALQAAGVIPTAGPADFKLEDSIGGSLTLAIEAGGGPLLPPHPANPANPLNMRNPQLNYWFNYLPEARALYIKYNACAESAVLSMKEFSAQVLRMMRSRPVNRVVFDLRHNGGGSDAVLRELLDAMGAAIRAGQLKVRTSAVITSRNTYSSAVINAWELKQAGSVVVGENTGGLPAAAEIRTFTLPNSSLTFRSTARLRPFIDGTFVAVDVPVEFTSADFFCERDPYLDAALAVNAKPPVFQ